MKQKFLSALCAVVVGFTGIALPASSSAEEVKIVDKCCFDLDGGGERDDGIFVISRGGTEILVAIIYEDPDRDKNFDARDIVRAVAVGTSR